ncbi:MAG: ROK family protein, partial [Clostridia bacterium]|nr:ROK family protein [Clostridia bacterium]
MRILKLTPALKSYIWGGQKLKKLFFKASDEDVVSESWELSFHPDGLTKTDGGYLCDVAAKKELGKNVTAFKKFPTLIKFIDANKDLSVQVHPTDAYALKNENSYGKTEMWYVVSADEGAGIYLGFAKAITKKQYKKAIADGTLTDIMNFVPVKAGDCYFIPAGTVHAIGKGCVMLEIQQNSNLTYRVYDYMRKDANGKFRPLHVEKALAVSDLNKLTPAPITGELLGVSKYFTVRKHVLGEKTLSADEGSFSCVTCVEGEGEIEGVRFVRGDSFFVPAGFGAFTLKGDATVITTEVRRYYVGIDIGGTFIKGGVVDDLGNILISDKIRTRVRSGGDAVIEDVAALTVKMLSSVGLSAYDVVGLGIGVPGLIDGDRGVVVYSNNLNWSDLDVKKRLEKLTGIKVRICNDADAAALCEHKFGAGKGAKNTVTLTLGTGVGSGVIINGKLYTGNRGAGVEIGHTVIDGGKRPCNCGRKGCIEAYCSATALIKSVKAAMRKNADSKMWKTGSLK